jgi:2',3'-cyclic-nucleotide 2'-phosphodiesterase (5'-nucleotidase family)
MDDILRKALEVLKENNQDAPEEELNAQIEKTIQDYVEKEYGVSERLREGIMQAISQIKIDAPTIPPINIPEIKLPTINVPESKIKVEIPEIKVPEANVTVTIPEIKFPAKSMVETNQILKSILEKMSKPTEISVKLNIV